MDREVPNPRPPVLLGCSALAAVVLLVVLAGVALVVFVESGADTGTVTMQPVAAYPPGTVTRVPGEGFYLVSLRGELIALSDLDAQNRAAEGRRCRVEEIAREDAAITEMFEKHGSRRSPAAANQLVFFTESCFGAVYDAAGIRLDADGPNLDRFEVGIDDDERLLVHTARRECSVRTPDEIAEPAECPD